MRFFKHVKTRVLGAGVRGFIREVLMVLDLVLQGHRVWYGSWMLTGQKGQTLVFFGLLMEEGTIGT
jgi:hypothetical protein